MRELARLEFGRALVLGLRFLDVSLDMMTIAFYIPITSEKSYKPEHFRGYQRFANPSK